MLKNSITLKRFSALLALCLLSVTQPHAQSIKVSCEAAATGFLGKEFGYRATADEVTLDDVEQLKFRKGKASVINLGVPDSTYWIHATLEFTEACSKYLEFDSHGITTLDAYVISETGKKKIYKLGFKENFGDWPIPNHNYTIPIEGGAGEEIKLYIRLHSNQQLLVPVRLFSPNEYWSGNLRDNLIFGIYFGIIFVMIFYNLFLFASVKDINYLYYVIYIFTVGLAQASVLGYSQVYLWPNSEWLQLNGTILTGALSGIFTIVFVIYFLKTAKFTPVLHKILWGVLALDVVAIVFLFVGMPTQSFNIVNAVAGLGSILVLVTGITILRKGFLPAKFFIVAYSFFLLSVIVYVLKDYGVLPYNEFTSKSVISGSAFEIVLLSLALANRINVLRKEKEESQAEALRVSRENEKIIREQNIMLEQKVNERTLELQEANEELTVTLSNLRDTQTQLVDAEKMASLGQLTAGIAHEINNPINFVTSNITPLKRDLDEMYELIDKYAEVTEETADKLREAHELKEELDYEYLKEEISSLVDGISDGATRTSEIVRGLRTFSRLDEDVIKQASLHEGLASTLVLLRSKLKEGIEVEQDFDSAIPEIECYPGKLNQVFMNILNNGIYAVMHKNYPEEEKPRITLRTKKHENTVSVHLRDNGIGMDEQTKKKMFDPFFTTKDVGEGTGLGMAIVYKIIEKHGGSLVVESELGKGTEFIITLPMRQPNEFE